MAPRRWQDIKERKLTGKQIDRIRKDAEREVLEMNLRALREMVGKTQVDIALATDMAQGDLSRFERRGDHLLSTLRRYVAALGGDVEVVAVIAGKRVVLHGV